MEIYFDPRLMTASRTSGSAAAASGTSAVSSQPSFQNVLSRTASAASVSAPSTLESIFAKASQKYGVPENLLKAVAKAESDFQADCVSSAGASGIMQLMPETAKEYGITDIFDPEQNIMGGAQELAANLKRYNGDIKLTLAGYNAGCGNVAKYGGIPPFAETQNYVKKVMSYMGQDIQVPNTTYQAAAASAGTSGVDTSGLANLLSTGSASGTSTADNTDFTYQDYQMFVGLIVNALKNGWDSDSSENSRSSYWYR